VPSLSRCVAVELQAVYTFTAAMIVNYFVAQFDNRSSYSVFVIISSYSVY